MKLLLTVEEAAEALGISRSQVYVLIAGERLGAVTIGRSRRVPVEALEAFVNGLREDDEAEPEAITPTVLNRRVKAVKTRARA